MKQRLVISRFAHKALTNFLFKGCEHAKPRYDHSLHFRLTFLFNWTLACFAHETLTNFLFKLVNMWHHTLSMKPWLAFYSRF